MAMKLTSMVRRALLGALAGSLLAASTATLAAGPYLRAGVSFALLGDTPYGTGEEVQFDRVIDEINASRNVRLVVHSGDVKAGSERCDDALLIKRFNQYQKLDDAFILTPGDNDWTDCHRTNNGSYLPTERLARFRQIFYPVAGMSSGKKPLALRSQATMPGHQTFVENTMWSFAGVTMATVHVVGSNNNLAPWSGFDATDSVTTPRADRIAEFQAREAASLAWVDATFDQAIARDSAGVVIAIQANPLFELASTHPERQGFNAFLSKLADRSKAFGKPVLLTHGDSHYFRLDKPMVLPKPPSGSAALENFSRLENFGSPSVHWVEVFVDARDPNVFSVVPHLVPGNVYPR
jgi:hypothetical protein